ncbi:LysE family translocator [Xenophilus sp. Marseille-Q4582]|uniref:LysE family translocator n=1 Tax=Xenophilus sp. Marseille-Q4582 TaxID=2866600 RepID=UPI001CE43122|nr:LysE family translocator [Xenophilus sp. Marseille-Q4582]
MRPDLLLAFMAYAFVTSITPGPNNTMLLASGLNHGFARSVPHILGISVGFALMVLGVGAGLGQLFATYPSLYTSLRVVGAVYLLWLAWQIATAQPMQEAAAPGQPFGFWKAAAFQWVNPKAWIMAIGAIATYAPAEGGLLAVTVIAALFAAVNAPSVALWAAFGTTLRRWLTDRRHLRLFNLAMALLLVLSLYPLLSGHTQA